MPPNWNRLVRERLAVLRLPPEREIEIVEEVSLHLEAVYEEALVEGLSEAEAQKRVVQGYDWRLLECELGRTERSATSRLMKPAIEGLQLKGGIRMESLIQDLRLGARMLWKQPGFTLMAVLTLALGIGANTAIFSVFNGVLLSPLPIRDQDRVVIVWNRGPAAAGGDRTPLSMADLLDWRAQSRTYEEIAAFQYDSFTWTTTDAPEMLVGASVTANFFSTLGVQPSIGRTFVAEEDGAEAPRVAVISDRLWRNRLGADPQAIGRALTLNNRIHTIIGVMPPALNFPMREADVWAPLQVRTPTRRGPYSLTGIARIKTGVTLQQAKVDTSTVKSTFEGGALDFTLLPVTAFIVGDVRPAIVAMLAAVMLVLLIATVNVANLTLIRAAGRAKEITIRTALGAGRGRIIRQLLTENLLLAAIGGALGVLGAALSMDLLVKLAPQDFPRLEQISIDGRVLGWTTFAIILSGVLCSLMPAWQNTRVNLIEMLKDGGRSSTEGGASRQWRSLLVVLELSLAVLLLVTAGLLLKSLWRLQRVDLGVNIDRVTTAYMELPRQRYSQRQQFLHFYDQVLEKARALPGVRSVALSNSLPPDVTEYSDAFSIEGRLQNPKEIPPIAYMIRVSPGYFETFSIGILRGRSFTNSDTANTEPVAIVSEATARQFFPGEDLLGKRINTTPAGNPSWVRIIGIVGDVKYNGLANEAQPAIYQPLAQDTSSNLALILKMETADADRLTPAIRNLIQSVDKDVPLIPEVAMQARLAAATAHPRFRTTLIVLFAMLALILAMVGIYGVLSYSVVQRTQEIGIRMALGAPASEISRLVLRQGAQLALASLGIGLLVSLALTPFLRYLLYRVQAYDPTIYLSTFFLLLLIALLACWIPARRAMRVDPMIALRRD